MGMAMSEIKIEKYSSYKDSGVEWIEDVPTHWEVKKFKRVFYEIKKRSSSELNCGSISFGKVVYKDDEKIPESTKKSYQVVLKGDFLVNPLNLNYDLISLRIALSDIDVVVSSGYIVLSNSVKVDKTYYKYFLHRFDVAFMKLLGSGVRQTLNWNDIANCDLIFPPILEQTAIANFLDRKTVLIDQAVDIKQKQIELLKEHRQILIHKAVTRGLNAGAKLKDSGVEWIGQIPEGWGVKRLKEFCKAFGRIGFRGYTTSDLVSEGEGAITISPSNIKGEFMTFEKCSYLSWNKYHQSPEIQIFEDDILMVKTGSTFGKIGIVKNPPQEATINPQLIVLKEIKINSDYFYTLLKTSMVQYQVQTEVIGSTIPTISETKILNFKVALPQKSEIEEILKYIETATAKIATAISFKEQEIEKLKEYKSTLINSAVTGKIKVSNYEK
jgi:type I restriction enzyme S subunit